MTQTAVAPRRRRVRERTFACGPTQSSSVVRILDGLREQFAAAGYRDVGEPGPEVQIVLHPVDLAAPVAYRRKAAPTFVVALAEVHDAPVDVLRVGYPLLVRALANLAVLVGHRRIDFVTLEQGTYTVEHTGDDGSFFAAVFERLEPLASSRLVIDNRFESDLPSDLAQGDEQTRAIGRAGAHLASLNLLPAAFPIEEILSERDLRHVQLLFGIGGLSYGNASARRRGAAQSAIGPEFWMSASGVDKSAMRTIGTEILLVRGYDAEHDEMVLSVPAGVRPRRVSVDAIEHWTIYREHPDVGAILHVHAWMEGIESTAVNYPCGTLELATAVSDLVRRAPDPVHAVVGQRNHGLTITGDSLDEILARVDGKLVRRVPMS
jgi:ribulose-5-phosphate 4-epimerase/fuculose-1-phosphate aldolase